jgi:hypothetical protein
MRNEGRPGKQDDGLDVFFSDEAREPILHSRRDEQVALPWPVTRNVFGRRATDKAPFDRPGEGRRQMASWHIARVAMPDFHVDNEVQDAPHESWSPDAAPHIDPFTAPNNQAAER